MPMPGSTSTWVRMRVVPCLMHSCSVRSARARTSSTVMLFLRGLTLVTGLDRLRSCGAHRSMMRDLSRWIWVSISPATGEEPLRVINRRLGGKPALDRDDPPSLDADIDELACGSVGKTRVADDQVHAPSLRLDVGSS